MPQMKYRDPATNTWVVLPTTGPRGIQGQDGVDGAVGPEGPVGPMTDEVWVGPDAPTDPDTVLWFDTDDDRLIGPAEIPPGGLANDALVKLTDADGDVHWRDLYTLKNGEVIQFANQADVAKILLYANTFGFGITGSTLNIFSSTYIKFNQNSITGDEWARIDNNGVHTYGSHFVAETDGMGLKMVGGAHVYKQTGGGLVLRRAANTAEVIIEDSAGGNRRNVATKPDSEATVAHNATNMDEVRAGQNYILYNDSIVSWHVSLTPKVLSENTWVEMIPPNGYPDFLRPSRTIEHWKAAVDSTGNATCIGIGMEITAAGKASYWKPGDGPDIKGGTVINIDFIYPRNY